MDVRKIIGSSQPWVAPAVLAGVLYAFVGIGFAQPTVHVKAWRWAAWGVSALAYAAHTCYERFGLRTPPRSGALHAASGVALGAFGLAIGANIHSLRVQSPDAHWPLLILALGLWPLITAVPAFFIGWAASWVLAKTKC